MPGRTMCPTCGRHYPLPERRCDFCAAQPLLPAVPGAEPGADFHVPPARIFKQSWPGMFVGVLVMTLMLAISTLLLATTAHT